VGSGRIGKGAGESWVGHWEGAGGQRGRGRAIGCEGAVQRSVPRSNPHPQCLASPREPHGVLETA
jgi:hypothetical protein